MSRQAHINEKMRAILIDWLVEVHLKSTPASFARRSIGSARPLTGRSP